MHKIAASVSCARQGCSLTGILIAIINLSGNIPDRHKFELKSSVE